MPKTSKKIKATTSESLSDELDRLDDFLYDPKEGAFLLEQANPNNRVQAKKKLGKLITQDAADRKGAVLLTPSTAAPSPHLTDLRQSTRLQKIKARGLDHLERPARRTWHLPSFKYAPRKTKDSGSLSVPKTDFLRHHEEVTKQPPVKSDRTKTVNPLVASLAFSLIALAIIAPIKTFVLGNKLLTSRSSIMAQSQAALNHLQQGIQSVTESDFQKAITSFESANANFQSIRDEINSYNQSFIEVAKQIPSVGPEVTFSTQLLTVGQNISQAAAILSAAGSKDLTLTESIAETRERFVNVRNAMVEANKNISLVPESSIPESVRPAIISFKSKAPQIIQDLEHGDKVMEIAYALLGGEHLSRQLIVFQNNRELRPTGGFMGSYAVADFNGGALSKFTLPGGGTYDTAGGLKYRLVPPYALQLISSSWNLWDANWWPDFPTSAKKISWFYQKSGGTTVDGVIAINASTVKNLLAVIGPIELPQYSVTIDSDNFYTQLQEEIQVNYDKSTNKPKQILGDLAPILMEKIINYPDKLKIVDVLISSLASRDIQLYSEHADIQQAIDELGWSGRQLITDGDYLQVVSTNVAGGKSDGYIDQTINHRAIIAGDGTIEATVTITKTNNAPTTDALGYMNNVDYMRVYVPAGSELLEAGGFQPPANNLFKSVADGATVDDYLKAVSGETKIDDQSGTRINQENSKTVFGNWMQVKPGQTSSVYFKYRLPQRITISNSTGSLFVNYWSPQYREVDSYSFLAQPQAGNDHTAIEHSLIIDPSFKTVWSNSLSRTTLMIDPNKIQFGGPLTSIAYYSLLLAGQ